MFEFLSSLGSYVQFAYVLIGLLIFMFIAIIIYYVVRSRQLTREIDMYKFREKNINEFSNMLYNQRLSAINDDSSPLQYAPSMNPKMAEIMRKYGPVENAAMPDDDETPVKRRGKRKGGKKKVSIDEPDDCANPYDPNQCMVPEELMMDEKLQSRSGGMDGAMGISSPLSEQELREFHNEQMSHRRYGAAQR